MYILNKIQLTSGEWFSQVDDETILDASLRSSISLPYSCRFGECMACKCKLVSGDTKVTHHELGLRQEEVDEGWILPCVRTATSDLQIDADIITGFSVFTEQTLPLKIHHISIVNDDVMIVLLRPPRGRCLHYYPGQYVFVTGPTGERRAYSIANKCDESGVLEFHIKYIPGGVLSEYWFRQARVGDLLRIRGPYGTFFLRDITNRDLYFLATGTGIAPIKAMLEQVSSLDFDDAPRSITVFWGGRRPSDFYMKIASQFGDFKFTRVVSRASKEWDGDVGYVQDILLDQGLPNAGSRVYACGSIQMINSALHKLTQAGFVQSDFYSDAFLQSY